MFQGKELERLRLKKEELVFRSDANRMQWMSDWQRLQAPERWLDEILGLARRRPLWIAGLATAAGMLVVKTLRQPLSTINGIGRLGNFIPVAFAVWRLLRKKWHQH